MNVEPWATELDELLAEWRTVHQLGANQAEQLYQTIIATPEGAMSEEWWRQYERYLLAIIQQAKELAPKAALNFTHLPGGATNRAGDSRLATVAVTQWQPYLKLA